MSFEQKRPISLKNCRFILKVHTVHTGVYHHLLLDSWEAFITILWPWCENKKNIFCETLRIIRQHFSHQRNTATTTAALSWVLATSWQWSIQHFLIFHQLCFAGTSPVVFCGQWMVMFRSRWSIFFWRKGQKGSEADWSQDHFYLSGLTMGMSGHQ